MKTVILIGHSKHSGGAYNKKYDVNEYQYNKEIAKLVSDLNSDVIVFERLNGYYILPTEINRLDPDLIISLHLNAVSNKNVEGCEVLSSGSKKSMKFAEIAQPLINKVFNNNDRGIKIRNKPHQRGYWILNKTDAPCVILEPYFVSNNSEIKKGLEFKKEYAEAINEAIKLYQFF